jgi:hypothetical protein
LFFQRYPFKKSQHFKENTPFFPNVNTVSSKQISLSKTLKIRNFVLFFKVLFLKVKILRNLRCFSVGPLQHTYEYDFGQTNSLLKKLKILLFVLFFVAPLQHKNEYVSSKQIRTRSLWAKRIHSPVLKVYLKNQNSFKDFTLFLN